MRASIAMHAEFREERDGAFHDLPALHWRRRFCGKAIFVSRAVCSAGDLFLAPLVCRSMCLRVTLDRCAHMSAEDGQRCLEEQAVGGQGEQQR